MLEKELHTGFWAGACGSRRIGCVHWTTRFGNPNHRVPPPPPSCTDHSRPGNRTSTVALLRTDSEGSRRQREAKGLHHSQIHRHSHTPSSTNCSQISSPKPQIELHTRFSLRNLCVHTCTWIFFSLAISVTKSVWSKMAMAIARHGRGNWQAVEEHRGHKAPWALKPRGGL